MNGPDRPTVLAAGLLAVYSFTLYALSPVLVFLRADLGLDYTLVSAHPALWAAGTIATGSLFDRWVRRVGRRAVLWVGLAGMLVGLTLLGIGAAVAVTLLAAGLLGFCGTLVQTGAFGVLGDGRPGDRDRALIQGTIVGAASALVAPLLFGRLGHTPWGWRPGLALPGAGVLTLAPLLRRTRLPPPTRRALRGARLPAPAWAGAALVGVSVAIEFCVVSFAPQLLVAAHGFSAGAASTALAAQYGGLLLGRILGARLAGSASTVPLLFAALALTAAGFVVFWLVRADTLALVGLAITGVGIAVLFPLALSLAVGAAGGAADAATARGQLLAGMAALVAPFALGAAADLFGLRAAFAVEPALLCVAAALVRAARPGR